MSDSGAVIDVWTFGTGIAEDDDGGAAAADDDDDEDDAAVASLFNRVNPILHK